MRLMIISIKIKIRALNIMAPLSSEAKAALLKRLSEGRAKTKAARAEAKEKGLADPKPRKTRKDKKAPKTSDGALQDPLAAQPANEVIPPIDGAPALAKNKVAAMPPSPTPTETSKIDVPHLPDAKDRKKIVEDSDAPPVAKPKKGISATGMPTQYNDNVVARDLETGDQAISVQYPGQKDSIKKLLKENKKDKPLAPMSEPSPPSKTIEKVPTHVKNIASVEAREPFSFSTVRKMLYQ